MSITTDELNQIQIEDLTWSDHIYPYLKECFNYYDPIDDFSIFIKRDDMYIEVSSEEINELNQKLYPKNYACNKNDLGELIGRYSSQRFRPKTEFPMISALWEHCNNFKEYMLIWINGISKQLLERPDILLNIRIEDEDYAHFKSMVYTINNATNKELLNIRIYGRTKDRFVPSTNIKIFDDRIKSIATIAEFLKFISLIQRLILADNYLITLYDCDGIVDSRRASDIMSKGLS